MGILCSGQIPSSTGSFSLPVGFVFFSFFFFKRHFSRFSFFCFFLPPFLFGVFTSFTFSSTPSFLVATATAECLLHVFIKAVETVVVLEVVVLVVMGTPSLTGGEEANYRSTCGSAPGEALSSDWLLKCTLTPPPPPTLLLFSSLRASPAVISKLISRQRAATSSGRHCRSTARHKYTISNLAPWGWRRLMSPEAAALN